MRIAVLILGLFLSLIMLLQSCAGFALSSVSDNLSGVESAATTSTAGGILAALIALVATAFALGLPLIAFFVYLLSSLVAFASAGEFPDMQFYGWLLLTLSFMSLGGWWGKRRAHMVSGKGEEWST